MCYKIKNDYIIKIVIEYKLVNKLKWFGKFIIKWENITILMG